MFRLQRYWRGTYSVYCLRKSTYRCFFGNACSSFRYFSQVATTQPIYKEKLHTAVETGDFPTFSKLLRECSVDLDLGDASKGGTTALLLSIRLGRIQMANELIEAGANVNKSGAWNFSPLMYCAIFGQTEIAEKLLSYGADKHAVDSRGDTALCHAVGERHLDIVALLDDPNPNDDSKILSSVKDKEHHFVDDTNLHGGFMKKEHLEKSIRQLTLSQQRFVVSETLKIQNSKGMKIDIASMSSELQEKENNIEGMPKALGNITINGFTTKDVDKKESDYSQGTFYSSVSGLPLFCFNDFIEDKTELKDILNNIDELERPDILDFFWFDVSKYSQNFVIQDVNDKKESKIFDKKSGTLVGSAFPNPIQDSPCDFVFGVHGAALCFDELSKENCVFVSSINRYILKEVKIYDGSDLIH